MTKYENYKVSAQVPEGTPAAPGNPQPVEVPPVPPASPAQPQQAPRIISAPQPESAGNPEIIENIDSKIRSRRKVKLIAVAVAVIAIAIAAYYLAFLNKGHPGPVATTTVPATQVFKISSCAVITSPGTYFITGTINTGISSGSCIDIKSSDVRLVGNGNKIDGSGPYVLTPPYTYGIRLDGVTNVTVTGVDVSKFSFDIYFNRSTESSVTNSSAMNGTVSGIYLSSSANNLIAGDNISGIASNLGGISLQGGGSDRILKDNIQGNAFYGVVVNSTGNRFSGDSFIGNPVDLVCSGSAGFRSSNNFTSSKCSINRFCNFAQCSNVNIPTNISTVTLSKQVSQCGSITSPGTYAVQENLNLGDYLNLSAPSSKTAACINIAAPDVKLDCHGNSIRNSGYGINIPPESSGLYNITVSDCVLSNDTIGINAARVFQFNVTGITLSGSVTGILLNNVTTGAISNSVLTGSKYGIYINATTGMTFSSLSVSNNTYGIYSSSGGSNIYRQDRLENNANQDLYCNVGTYKAQSNLFSGNTCGVSDCGWAACSVRAPPPISVLPVTSCETILKPGNYSLTGNVNKQGGNCFVIAANNVDFSCNNYLIINTGSGSAFMGDGVSNDTISGCNIQNFGLGMNFTNTAYLSINGINVNASATGLSIYNAIYAKFSGIRVLDPVAAGFAFNSLDNSTVTGTSVNATVDGKVGYSFNNSSGDAILSNNAIGSGGHGFSFVNSINNRISNNTASDNAKGDYYCSADSSGLYAQQGGVNNGVSKVDCRWLVEIPPVQLQSQCMAISGTTLVSMSSDIYYPYGQTCYTVYNTQGRTLNRTSNTITVTATSSANGTVINCNGHTIFASKGGTFVRDINASNVRIENCYIKNFTTPIISGGSYTEIINNTVGSANASITLSNAKYATVANNRVENASYGVYAQGSTFGSIRNNTFADVNVSLSIIGGSNMAVNMTNATGGAVGMYMIGADQAIIGNNRFSGFSKEGILCSGGSVNVSSGNLDTGGNACLGPVATNCKWMTASPLCRS